MTGFRKATKEKTFLRCALYGPSGSGKTFTALRVANGIGGPIAFIDTERGSACKYADRFEFDVLELADRTIAGYIAAMGEAVKAGYRVVIIDSLSHAWQELLDEVDRATASSRSGNSWQQWANATPKQRKLVDAILRLPAHLICTMRAKTEWTQETNERGKTAPKRVGLTPEQGKGIEYEFDLLCAINQDHWLTVEKDRTGKYQDAQIEKPGEEFGKALAEWLESGEAPAKPAPAEPPKATEQAAPPEPAPASWTDPDLGESVETDAIIGTCVHAHSKASNGATVHSVTVTGGGNSITARTFHRTPGLIAFNSHKNGDRVRLAYRKGKTGYEVCGIGPDPSYAEQVANGELPI
jgi:hypothetical protein